MPQGKWAFGENAKQVAQKLFRWARGCSAKCKETGSNGPEPFLLFAPSLTSPNTRISSVLLQISHCLVQSPATLYFSDLLFHPLAQSDLHAVIVLVPPYSYLVWPGSFAVTAFSELPACVFRRNVSCTSYFPSAAFTLSDARKAPAKVCRGRSRIMLFLKKAENF